jgi:hypothetical protein
MMSTENRFTLFGIMLVANRCGPSAAVAAANWDFADGLRRGD